jgi:CheY-like chemotaxis protein
MRKTILVIESDRGRRKALVKLLIGEGYDVIAGEDYQAALQMVGRLGVDVMISDLQLSSAAPTSRAPGRPSRRRRASPKRLLVSRVPVPTGHAARGADDILPIPLDRTVLLDKVRALLA